MQDSVTALDGAFDRAQQRCIVDGLGQELDRATLHGLHRGRHVTVAGDENDRQVEPLGADTLLQLEPVQVRQRHVQHQAAGSEMPGPVEEFLTRRKRLRLPTCAADQRFQRLAHGDVVVDDEYGRRGPRHGQ